MLMLNLSDHRGMMDVVVWPEQYQKFYTQLATAEALRITGKVAESFGVCSLEAKEIEKVEFGAIEEKNRSVKTTRAAFELAG